MLIGIICILLLVVIAVICYKYKTSIGSSFFGEDSEKQSRKRAESNNVEMIEELYHADEAPKSKRSKSLFDEAIMEVFTA